VQAPVRANDGSVLADVPAPGDDPFYGQPDDLGGSGPGTILDHRHVELRMGRRPLLAYRPAIDSLGPAGGPSYALRRGDQLEPVVMRRS